MKEYVVRIYPNRSEWFNKKGQLHREEGPAIEYVGGNKEWYLNGQLHRVDGPAIELPNGDKEWFLNGIELTEKEFLKRTQPIQEMTMEEVCKALGRNVKIVK